ncbi:MAG: aminotransferase class I/II-fold pyridoxal phosphate-dependent enzyme [Erysipelotrichaceae bacterium]|jgi:methionine-gamma-lyase|nr:aminotransferase class I/II-fold pyridoxal phosphate-dependent enzyme [Erysipelotrichaceae bacterium]
MNKKNAGMATQAIHGGEIKDQYGAQITPVYRNSTFHFESPKAIAEAMNPEEPGYVYSRVSNPTVRAFEQRIAILENAKGAIAFGSGSAAITAVILSLISGGEHAVYSQVLYDTSHHIFTQTLPRFKAETTVVDPSDLAAVEAAIQENTKMIYVETPANPTLSICDLKEIAKLAKKHGVLAVCDNTFASAYNTKPLDLGFDVVLESATKYVNGHGDGLGGFVCANDSVLLETIRREGLINYGGVMAPDIAFLLLRGLKTFPMRVKAHSENALALAKYFESHPKVEKVYYPGLPSHPGYEIAKKQMKTGGGMIVIEVAGGLEGASRFVTGFELASYAASLGDADTLVEHPATMTHARMTPEERQRAGIGEGMIRISVGLEDIEDIIEDFENALNRI